MAWLPEAIIKEMGFSIVGRNPMLSNKASFYNCKNISLGDNVRVDDFCVLSAGVGGFVLGDHVHIAVNVSMLGSGQISVGDFSGISARCAIYSSNDDYSGMVMTGPTVPPEFTNVRHANVKIGRHVIVGAGSIVLPGVTLGDGVAIGALSLVKTNCDAFGIYTGVPAKRTGERRRDLLELEQTYRKLKALRRE